MLKESTTRYYISKSIIKNGWQREVSQRLIRLSPKHKSCVEHYDNGNLIIAYLCDEVLWLSFPYLIITRRPVTMLYTVMKDYYVLFKYDLSLYVVRKYYVCTLTI